MYSEKLPQESHRSLIRCSFTPLFELSGFDRNELNLLTKYGTWFRALADGIIEPLTADQERFVRVANGEIVAVSVHEKTWIKYMQQEKNFKENRRDKTEWIRTFIQDGSLGYERLQLLLDKSMVFEFTEQDFSSIQQQIVEKRPLGGVTKDSYVVYSSTDGQD